MQTKIKGLINGRPDVVKQGPFDAQTIVVGVFGLTFWVLLFLKLMGRFQCSWLLVILPAVAAFAIAIIWTLLRFLVAGRRSPKTPMPWLDDKNTSAEVDHKP